MARLAMQGVSVLDFTWFGVGPIATKYLADNGATVVKVESIARPDGLRLTGPWKDARPDINRSQFFGSFNSSKKSVMLDMSRREARDIVRRLVPHFDVVANSYTPGVMPKWGLGYDDLRQIRPDVIVLSTCMQGQTGPHAQYRGFGQLMASLSGFFYLSGYSETEIAPLMGPTPILWCRGWPPLPCWPPWTIAAGPDVGSISTSPSTKRPSTSSRPPWSTTRHPGP